MDDVAEFKRLKAEIDACHARLKSLADERQRVTRRLYDQPGMTTRKLAALLGVSQSVVSLILRRGTPKPGKRSAISPLR